MASIRKAFVVEAPLETTWAAFRDVGAVHTKLARGFVTDCRMDGDARVVTFANGFVAREVIVDVDEKAHRLAYSARSERLSHHNASFQLSAETGQRTRVVWRADLLPNDIAPTIAAMMEQGCAAMKKTLDVA